MILSNLPILGKLQPSANLVSLLNPASQLQSKVLRSTAKPDDYRIYKAALEWDLTDPIVIESKKDMKSASRWRDRVEPFSHQVSNLITFCRRLPVTLLADDVGLGKTISAGLIMSELIARARLSKVLIVCPKLLGPQWKEELETKFDIPAIVVAGKELLAADPDDVGAVITTYDSARLYLDRLPADRFQMLVLDEAHKLRNLYGTEKPPKVAQRFRQALQDRRFRFVLMLTATPIQNRLWDLYSLVDLLTVARGHENPFGNEGKFARRFIADGREQARQLKPDASEEFRNIVYGYMSRVRRGDAKLHFPSRQVQLHKVQPTPAELRLIAIVGKAIQPLNRLAQISILQALTSSPHALTAQLDNMARNGTVPGAFATEVRTVVREMTTSAKLIGLGALIDELKRKDPNGWRLVVFTGRRETQTTIQSFLEEYGLTVGLINGTTGPRNQATLAEFRAEPPGLRVIVSTEAGSEGVNLQIANVLVNYDLPWNPMIVEQRIGRVQRLASKYEHVAIFNITLLGTFEEYIVGRLMEKLQMSTSAIGDIESLLEGAGAGSEDGEGFEEKIRALVVAALTGADVRAVVAKAAVSIDEAKTALKTEEERINQMLGGMDGVGYVGPRAPSLPAVQRSMSLRDFTLDALANLGARISPRSPDVFEVEEDGGREQIRFDANPDGSKHTTVYSAGTPVFAKLVQRLVASGVHAVTDRDAEPRDGADRLARGWVSGFAGTIDKIATPGARLRFEGNALVRVRATVAHDSYDRLIEVLCRPLPNEEGTTAAAALAPLPRLIERPDTLGIDPQQVVEAAERDEGIAEFTRFYLERRAQEMAAAGSDERKRKKMEDDFTPRLAFTLVGAEGAVYREVQVKLAYQVGGSEAYETTLTVVPSNDTIVRAPTMATCSVTNRTVPDTCLGTCAVTGGRVLKSRLAQSEFSGRTALLEHTELCGKSGKRLIADEIAASDVSGQRVGKHLLKTSDVSRRRAEFEHFGTCAFTGATALLSELRRSDLSGKPFRADQAKQSGVSSRTGHADEFTSCNESGVVIAHAEAERCAVTGSLVCPGMLQRCEETAVRALPRELGRCTISGKTVVKRLLVASSVSQARMLEREALTSTGGAFCAPHEAKKCGWSDKATHPDDLRQCTLTGLTIHAEHATTEGAVCLKPLVALLDGTAPDADRRDLWETAEMQAELLGKGKYRTLAAKLAPSEGLLAAVTEIRTMLGLKKRYAGFLLTTGQRQITGRIAFGKRQGATWIAE